MTDQTSPAPARLKLRPVRGQPISVEDFFTRCAANHEMCDSVWERLVSLIIQGGTQPPTTRYLRGLKLLGIPSYNVFAHIVGSELTIHEIFGSPLVDQMLVLLGPPGSGKTAITLTITQLLRGQVFHVIEGCPHTEQAINLLRFFQTPEEMLAQLGHLGNPDQLVKLWKRALPPCEKCFKRAFGLDGAAGQTAESSLDIFKVVPIRLDTREGLGMTVWTAQPDDKDAKPLKQALKKGSHLCILRDPFAAKGARDGSVPQTHVLLQAVQESMLDEETPFSGLVATETNREGWEKFKELTPDPGAYVRRSRIVNQTYNRSVSQELVAYRNLLGREADCPAWDPFALDVIAHLSCYSRLRYQAQAAVDETVRLRIHDGDTDMLEACFGEQWARKADTKGGEKEATAVIGTDRVTRVKQARRRFEKDAGVDEGFGGLSMSFMLVDVVNKLRQAGLAYPDKRVTVFQAIAFLSDLLMAQMNSTDAATNKEQKALYERCLKQLELAKFKSDKPALVEQWFRAWLKVQVERCFSPESENLKNQRFWEYRQHAKAISSGEASFEDELTNKTVQTSEEVLKELETLMPSLKTDEDKRKFRAGLRGKIRKALDLVRTSLGDPTADIEATWETIPELKAAIADQHTKAVLAKIQLCLGSGADKQLEEKDELLRVESRARFKALGYSEASAEEALRYYISFELWRDADHPAPFGGDYYV